MATVTITGSLYDSQSAGNKITTGRLYIRPQSFIRDGANIIIPKTIMVDVPGSGDLSFGLTPSNGVLYDVEFDPAPSDTATPRKRKYGYWRNTWTVPASGPVNINTL